jgi:hypothetical protein
MWTWLVCLPTRALAENICWAGILVRAVQDWLHGRAVCRLTRRVIENKSVRLELGGGAVREPAVSPHPCLLLAVANNNAWHVLAGTTTSPCSCVHTLYCSGQTAFVLCVAECILTCLIQGLYIHCHLSSRVVFHQESSKPLWAQIDPGYADAPNTKPCIATSYNEVNNNRT